MKDTATGQQPLKTALRRFLDITTGELHRAKPAVLKRWIGSVDTMLKRERSKGRMRHWSYDLNRHIALKELRDHLEDELHSRSAHRQNFVGTLLRPV